MASTPCSHLSSIQILEAPDEVDGCETCLAEGGHWVHLRMCVTCGMVGCCDDSVNQHARKHAEAEGHPIVRSIEVGETWCFCFVDDAIFQVAGVEPRVEEQPHRIVHNEDVDSIDLWVGNDVVGTVSYSKVGDAINVTSVAAAEGKAGLGYENELMRETINIFENRGRAIIPSDEFARAYIKYRPDLHHVIPGSMRARMFGESDD